MTTHTLQPQAWIDNYADSLYSFTLKRINNQTQLAEDIVQEVFLSAWRSRESYNGSSSEKNWLFTICKNKIIDHYRKAANNNTEQLDDHDNGSFFDADGHFSEQFKPAQDWGVTASDNKLERKEFYKVLQKCKNKLKEMQAAVFSMKYLEHLEAEEICAVLNISNENYWTLIHRAKVQLRKCLELNWINA